MNLYVFILMILPFIAISSIQLQSNCNKSQKPNGVLSSSLSKIQTGSHKLMSFQMQRRYNYYNITLNQKFTLQNDVAISIENIYSFQPMNGLDFFIRGNHKENRIQIIFVIDVDAKWSSIKIYYAISQRSDLLVGNFIANNNQFLIQKGRQSYEIQYYMQRIIRGQSDYIYTLPFINGIKTFDQNLTIEIIDARMNTTNGILQIDLKIEYDIHPLQHIYISYLMINLVSQLQVINWYGSHDQPSNSNIFVGFKSIYPIYQFINKTKSIRIKGALANPYPQDNSDMFGIDGIILQTQDSFNVLFLSNQIKNTIQKTYSCISKRSCNGLNGKMIYNTQNIFHIISTCIVCMKTAIYNETLKKCTCRQGFIQSNGTCIPNIICPQKQIYNQVLKQCVCANFYVNKSSQCSSIFQLCSKNSIYYKEKCYKIKYKDSSLAKCKNGTIFMNKSCVERRQCLSSAIYNKETNQCQCPISKYLSNNGCIQCQNDQIWNGTACICKNNTFKIEGKCTKCNDLAFFNGKFCQCPPNYIGNGFVCTLNSNEQGLAKTLNSKYILGRLGSNKKNP